MRFFYKIRSVFCLCLISLLVLSGFDLDNTTNFHMNGVRAYDKVDDTVYLGGQIWGYDFNSNGVLVVSTGSVLANEGMQNVLDRKQLQAGDVIKSINGKQVFDANDIEVCLNDGSKIFSVVAMRKDKEISVELKPAYDVVAQKFKLGLWVRNNFSGVGTVTFIKKNGRFGALGHPILPNDECSMLNVKNGDVFDCSVLGIKPALSGKTGEVLGVISRKNRFGSLDTNCEFGVFGNLTSNEKENMNLTEIKVGKRKHVKTGKAQIFCALNGDDVKAYDIEIIKTNYQSVSSDKSLVFRLTDKTLLGATGGIVQGMSGSPIVQNGMLVGAVTHVFLNDSTKGFGIYIDWMIDR